MTFPKIKFCNNCRKFTMNDVCCENKTVSLKPDKYSPHEKTSYYRRLRKYFILQDKNLK